MSRIVPGLLTVKAMCLASSDQEMKLSQLPAGKPLTRVSRSLCAGRTRSSVKSTTAMAAEPG